MDLTRHRNAATITGGRIAWRAAGSGMSFVTDGGTYRLEGAAWGRFHPTLQWLGSWYYDEIAPGGWRIPWPRSNRFGTRPLRHVLFLDIAFHANGEWGETIPHGGSGVVRTATAGHSALYPNPWTVAPGPVPYSDWSPAGHPWSQGAGGAPEFDPHRLKPFDDQTSTLPR